MTSTTDYDDDWSWYEWDEEEWPMEEASTVDGSSDVGAIPEAERLQEAYTIAQEANKTLEQARQAVTKVRAARGYYDPSGMKGSKGSSSSPSRSPSKGGKSKGKGKGPCLTCGSTGHGWMNCPDRWSKGGSPKGKSKGKNKGKKGKRQKGYYIQEFFVDLDKYTDLDIENDLEYVNVMSLMDDQEYQNISAARVIVDTGATESVAGVASMARLLDTMGPAAVMCQWT